MKGWVVFMLTNEDELKYNEFIIFDIDADEISLDYLLESRNFNDEIYDCDVNRFFGIELGYNKRKMIKEKLMLIRDKL